MRLQIKALYKGQIVEAEVPYEKGTVQKLPDEYPFNQNIYLTGDDGVSLRYVYIREDGTIEYCRSDLNIGSEVVVLSPFKDERFVFQFKLIKE